VRITSLRVPYCKYASAFCTLYIKCLSSSYSLYNNVGDFFNIFYSTTMYSDKYKSQLILQHRIMPGNQRFGCYVKIPGTFPFPWRHIVQIAILPFQNISIEKCCYKSHKWFKPNIFNMYKSPLLCNFSKKDNDIKSYSQ